MIYIEEAARKIAVAYHELQCAKAKCSAGGQAGEIKSRQRRLRLLLRMFVRFKTDPAFQAVYKRELAALQPSRQREALLASNDG